MSLQRRQSTIETGSWKASICPATYTTSARASISGYHKARGLGNAGSSPQNSSGKRRRKMRRSVLSMLYCLQDTPLVNSLESSRKGLATPFAPVLILPFAPSMHRCWRDRTSSQITMRKPMLLNLLPGVYRDDPDRDDAASTSSAVFMNDIDYLDSTCQHMKIS